MKLNKLYSQIADEANIDVAKTSRILSQAFLTLEARSLAEIRATLVMSGISGLCDQVIAELPTHRVRIETKEAAAVLTKAYELILRAPFVNVTEVLRHGMIIAHAKREDDDAK